MASCGTEILFAQRLASNEGKVRGRAIKNLRKYLEIRSKSKNGFKEEDFLKIFKGLHYCLWMQDKPLLQEELISKITNLLHVICKEDLTFSFIKIFFVTEVREWPTIDKHRLDKFMLFVRKFFSQTLKYLQNNSWKTEQINHMNNVLLQTILDYNATNVSCGIRMHFNDIFLDELRKTDLSEISTENFCLCLQPFITFVTKSKQKEMILDMIQKVFTPLVNTSIQGIGTYLSTVARDWLADKFFAFGSSSECTEWQRKQFYSLVRKIRDQETRKAERMKENSNKHADEVEAESERELKKVKKSPAKKAKITRRSLRSSVIPSETDTPVKEEADCTTNIKLETPKKLKRKTSLPVATSDTVSSETPVPKKRKKAMTPRRKLAEIKSNGESTQTPQEIKSDGESTQTPRSAKKVATSAKKNKAELSVTPKNKLNTPNKLGSDCKKKVVFDMQKNTALKFKKTMAVSPFPNSPSAYCPSKQPEQSILKASPRT